MRKVLIGSAEIGGTLSLQKELVKLASNDLESQLNANGVGDILCGGACETSHALVMFAIVEYTPPKTKKGKGE